MSEKVVGVESRNAGISPATLAALRRALQEQREFRLEQLRQYSPDALNRAAEGQVEVHMRLFESARAVLTDVEDALTRMDEGRYGRCLVCEQPIPVERLEIVPQARYCVRCQQARESRR